MSVAMLAAAASPAVADQGAASSCAAGPSCRLARPATAPRALESLPKASWVASARYARANATNGNATTVGIGAGADWFLIGRDNEGLRIGPRLEGSFGSESYGSRTSYARLGLSGELGYNFVASNGIAALAAVGFGGRLAGDEQNETFTSFTGGELGPYLKLGIGYGF